MGPIKLIFLDIPAGVAVDETIELTESFHDLMSLLSRMSGSVCKQIKGLEPQYQLSENGFNLSDGCWWYRIVKVTSTQAQEADSTIPLQTKGNWCRLATLFAYDYMRGSELASSLPLNEGWIEVQHDLQKKRDEATAAKAQQQDKNWRSSIGHTQSSPEDDNTSIQPASASPSATNTNSTSLPSVGGKGAVKQGVASHQDAESDSVGSCTSTEQVEQLLEAYQAQAYPLVVEWSKPPRCALLHLNENQIAEDAESRNHQPVRFPTFEKGEEHAEGLPSYTPRPGPFPAQIGRPPSSAYCAYEICNDIEYHPESPNLEEARIRPAESQALHDERYHGNIASRAQALAAKIAPLQTSISLPNQNMRYDSGSNFFEPALYHMQSAPAHMQSFAQSPWTGMPVGIGSQQPAKRHSSQETYRSHSSDKAPYQAANYFGSGSYNPGGQPSRHAYQSQSLLRSSSNPMRLQQYDMPPLSSFSHQSAVRYPSHAPQPQEIVPSDTPARRSSYQFGGLGVGNFPDCPQVNTGATEENEFIDVSSQSQRYHASQPTPGPSRQPTPKQYSRSSGAAQQPSGSYPPSRTASRQSSRVLLPGFSAGYHGTEAPTFDTANEFSQSFDMLARGLDPAWPSNGSGAGRDPALEVNQPLSRQSQMHYANHYTMPPNPATGPTRGNKICPRLSAHHGQSQNQPSYNRSRPGQHPFSGQFSPPKPRMRGKYAVKVLDRYNCGGLSPSRTSESATIDGLQEPLSSGTSSLFNEVSKGLSEEYHRVVFPAHQHTGPPPTHSSDQESSSPGPKSTASNFSDDFILKDSGTSKKKAKAKAKAKTAKRGAAKDTDAVRSSEESTKNGQDLVNNRTARAKRRSNGNIETETETEAEAVVKGQ